MAFKPFKRVKAGERVLDQIQENIEDSLGPVIKNARLDSQILKGVSLTAAKSTAVAHQLGRDLSGWVVVRQYARADIWEDSSNKSPGLFVYLHCSADVVVDLEVF